MMNRVAALLLLPIYTQFLTPHDYGIKELVGLSSEVIGILLATAISGTIYRFYFEYEREEDRNAVISTAIITIACFGLFALVILSFATKYMAEYILDSRELYYYFIISFASIWFQSLNDIGNNYLRVNRQSLKFICFSLGKLLLAIGFNIYFICFLHLGVLGILISTLISSLVVSILLMVPICFKVKLRFSTGTVKEMLAFGLPMIPSQLGAFIVHLSDRFFIKGYCSIADAGLYSLGYRFGALPSNFISAPFNEIWQPRRFEIYKQEGSEVIFGKIFTYFITLMVFFGLLVSVLTKEVLIIIADPKFLSAHAIVPIIVVATTIFSFHYHLNMGILIAKKTKYLAYINFSNGLFILLLNFWMIPRWGVFGAAYATLISFFYKICLTYYFSSRYYKIYFEISRIIKILLAAAVIYAVSYYLEYDHIAVTILMKLFIVGLFPVLLIGLSFLSKEEKKKIIEFKNRKYSSRLKKMISEIE